MPKMIVTGGAGFIGSNFVRLVLAKTEAEVVVFDKLTYAGRLESLEDLEHHPRLRFVRGDIAERDQVRALLAGERPSAVVNFAAESHVDRSIDAPGEFIHTNVVGTFELLEAARHHVATLGEPERSAFRLLHVSTDEVYGTLEPDDPLFSETTAYAPNSPYAASKAAADHLVRAYFHTYKLPLLLTNCSNNYGPYQFPEKLIPLMILNAAEGKPLPIYGDGLQVRDWLHVEDHCTGVLTVLERGRPGEKYNIGAHDERTNRDVVGTICRLLEEQLPAAANPHLAGRGGYLDLLTAVADRPGHDRRYAIDSAKLRSELGWRPRYGFEDGLRQTIRWYLEHRGWCEAVQSGTYRRERLGLG